jgi:RNA polymerase sigma factor (sigma-70 family)
MRAAVVLHYFADLSVAQTAKVLGKSQNTVKAQLREAISQLRNLLGNEPRG